MSIDSASYRMESTLAFFVEEIRQESCLISVPEFSTDSSLRHQHFKFRMAQNHQHHKSANQLLNKMYSWRGYDTRKILELDPGRITLIAYSNEEAVGTLSIGSDSSKGLFADELYHEELNVLRAQGRSISEFRNFAVEARIKSMRLLARMIHITYLYLYRILNHSDGVFEVNPRHAGFYEKKLGFTRIGPERICPRVNAPAVLLRNHFPYMAEQIKKFGGLTGNAPGEKSLYPYFFSQAEETAILARLRNCSI